MARLHERANAHKAAKTKVVDNLTEKTVKLFNPRTQNWSEHFDFTKDKTEIIGKTPCGRAAVESLQMNNFYQIIARSIWVEMNKFSPKQFKVLSNTKIVAFEDAQQKPFRRRMITILNSLIES